MPTCPRAAIYCRVSTPQQQDHASLTTQACDALQLSFEQISSFAQNWQSLDEAGKQRRLHSIIKQVSVTPERVAMELFLDVGILDDLPAPVEQHTKFSTYQITCDLSQ